MLNRGTSVGIGRRGPITAALQKRFFDIVEGRAEDQYGWLTPVYSEVPETASQKAG